MISIIRYWRTSKDPLKLLLTDELEVRGGFIRQVQHFLTEHFGGATRDYPYWRCSPTSFRIRLPHTISQSTVLEQGNIWGAHNGWRLLRWNTTWDARRQDKTFRVRIKITNFPEEFWHPFFIRQLVSHFGDIQNTDGENIRGHNHMNLRLWIKCIDPRRIPYSSVISYGNLWKECHIQVISWEYTADLPPDLDLPPSGDSGERYGEDSTSTEYFVRRSMLSFHDRIIAHNRDQPSSPEPSSSNQTDSGEPGSQHLNPSEPGSQTLTQGQDRGNTPLPKDQQVTDINEIWNPCTLINTKAALRIGTHTMLFEED